MVVPLRIQSERSHTQYPPPVLLSLMVPSTRQPECRFGIIVRYTWIDLIPLCSCLSPYALRVVSMRTLHGCFSYTRIVKLVFWPENYLRNRFLQGSRLSNLKGSVGLILAKVSSMWDTIPIDLSTRSFIPLPRFLNSRRVPPLLNQSLVLIPQQTA